MQTRQLGIKFAIIGAAFSLLLAACGDDDDDAGGSPATTEAAADTTATTGAEGEFAELCALAEQVEAQEDFPSADQARQYQELAPEELSEQVQLAGDAIIDNDGDPVATFAAFADDDVEAAIDDIDAFETAECGIEHEEAEPPEGVTTEIEDDAARVDVSAVDYSFEFEEPIAAGRTSFVLVNQGAEAHFLLISQLAEGVTLEEALAFEGDPEEAGLITGLELETDLAAPGGEDEEVVTADLEPGNYGMLCFIPAADGTPHAFLGMAVPFTVS